MKRIFTFLLALFSIYSASAYEYYDFFYKDIYYNILSDTECEVTYQYMDSSSEGNFTYQGNVVIPSQVRYGSKSYNVVKIGKYAFYNNKQLKSITIPPSVVDIDSHAFFNCVGLSDVVLQDGDEELAGYLQYGQYTFPFSDCPLQSLYCGRFCKFPITSSTLKSLAFGNKLKKIGNITNCPNLTEIEFPETVESIGFISKCNISNVTLPKNVKYLYGFDDVPLTSLTLPEGLRELKTLNYTNITSIELPSTLETIGASCFNGSPIKTLTIPESVTSMEEAFRGNDIIESIVINANITNLGYSGFYCCEALKSIILPNSLTDIEASTFAGCINLQSITIPNSVETIGQYAFLDCTSLEEITLGFNVNVIDQNVFKGCTSLKKVTSLNPNPPFIIKDTFEPYHYEQTTLYANGLNYSWASYWENFKNIEVIDASGVESVETDSLNGNIVGIYDISGKPVDKNFRGIVIVKYSNGTSRKLVQK